MRAIDVEPPLARLRDQFDLRVRRHGALAQAEPRAVGNVRLPNQILQAPGTQRQAAAACRPDRRGGPGRSGEPHARTLLRLFDVIQPQHVGRHGGRIGVAKKHVIESRVTHRHPVDAHLQARQPSLGQFTRQYGFQSVTDRLLISGAKQGNAPLRVGIDAQHRR